MSENSGEQKPQQRPEMQPQKDSEQIRPHREKEISRHSQSDTESVVEKDVPRQRRAEVQNPLMHESY